MKYPTTFKDNTQDSYHGTIIKDPYRWLEDDNSKATKEWVIAQNKVTFDYLNQIPFRRKIKNRLKELWNYERFSTPILVAEQRYIFRNDGLQNQAILYKLLEDDQLKIILDPNEFSADGTTSLGEYSFSKDGKYLAYQISEGGSDWRKIKILELASGEHLADELEQIKFSGMSWQGNGFYYSRYPKPKSGDELSARNVHHKLYFHKVNTAQSDDILIHETPDFPNRGVFANTTDDQRFTGIGLWESTSGNALYFLDRENANVKTAIFEEISHDFSLVGNIGNDLLILTNYHADNNRVIIVDSRNPSQKNWRNLIPESEDKLEDIELIGDKIFATYTHNVSSKVRVFDLAGKPLEDVKLPGIGTIGAIHAKRNSETGFFTYTSFTQPATIYSLDVKDHSTRIYKAPKVKFDPTLFETKQIWYDSKDGTKVPMFITYKKGIKLDGNNPTLLYGYGGFNVSVPPAFSVQRAVFIENGGVFVVANIRGGGEFGKKWHQAGTLASKQNVFDDFIAAAEYLIKHQYTSSENLGIEGGSNGGLLVGACMTQRPELFAVAFPRVGVLDMLRYDKFTIGRAWSTDYGLSENKDAFKYLFAYSPLHNVRCEKYPATMVMTADHDDRVVPAHSFKFAATLQDHQKGNNPVLIRIETSAGHGAGKPISKLIDEAADLLSFMFYNMKATI